MNSQFPPDLRNLIEQRLAERNMKRKDLAALVGVSQPSISRYINNVKFPKPSLLVALCLALRCDVGDIYQVRPPENKVS